MGVFGSLIRIDVLPQPSMLILM